MPNEIRLFPWEFRSMDEYSTSLPTATTMWKQWKRRLPSGRRSQVTGELLLDGIWIVGQYVPHHDPNLVRIRWSRVMLKHGPQPRRYEPPDWGRTFAYGRHDLGYAARR